MIGNCTHARSPTLCDSRQAVDLEMHKVLAISSVPYGAGALSVNIRNVIESTQSKERGANHDDILIMMRGQGVETSM
eukprot:scaffold247269_cov41-Prasinocladus_malaysianus.AAC.1